MKRYMIRITVESEPEDTARLRSLLPSLLEAEGFAATTGTTIIEAWYPEATEKLKSGLPMLVPGAPGVVSASGPKRKRGMGRGPNS